MIRKKEENSFRKFPTIDKNLLDYNVNGKLAV